MCGDHISPSGRGREPDGRSKMHCRAFSLARLLRPSLTTTIHLTECSVFLAFPPSYHLNGTQAFWGLFGAFTPSAAEQAVRMAVLGQAALARALAPVAGIVPQKSASNTPEKRESPAHSETKPRKSAKSGQTNQPPLPKRLCRDSKSIRPPFRPARQSP